MGETSSGQRKKLNLRKRQGKMGNQVIAKRQTRWANKA